MNSQHGTPRDENVRDRLVSDFDRNFLVEAGAGSGKTHSLATRMAAGIAAGRYTVERMAVVTFTRKAAAELRARFQLAVEDRLRGNPPEPQRQRLEVALAGIEHLFAGTIHAFCAHLLRERPVDAHVAPGFLELSDIEDLRRRRAAWREFVASARAAGLRPMLDLLDAGIRPKDLDAAFAIVCEHEDVQFDPGEGRPPDAAPVWRRIDTFWKKLCDLKPDAFDEKTTCPVQQRFDEFADRLRPSRRQRFDALASFLAAWGKPKLVQKWWAEEGGRDKSTGRQAKDLVDRFQSEVVEPFHKQWWAYVHRLSMEVLVAARDFYAAWRRRHNVVNYVDLLRVTSAMLRAKPDVRRALQAKYRFLFIDEFQDTDPIQAEIFLMLAAGERKEGAAGARQNPVSAGFDPFAAPLRPGALFVVGDPKQSIFRFRRADIDSYNRVARRIEETGGEALSLTANFRSLPSVCDVANTVFPPLFAQLVYPYSPAFERLDPVRGESEASAGPRVAKITIPDSDDVDHVAEEARRIAAYIKTEVSGGRRKFGDFLVLNRMRPRLRTFAEAFDAAEVPVDVSGAGMFCDSREVRTLSALLGALADPLDSVALVGVLRGPLFGLSDPELFRFSQAGGRFDLWAPLPDNEASGIAAVLAAMRKLQGMWRDTRALPLGAAVDRMLEETGWLALAATTPGCAPAGHLLQAVDLVREVAEDGGGLREAADALNEEEQSSESEALPLEPGRRDVVRLMNLHKAKGLEADVVFLADAVHAYQFPVTVRIVREGDGAKGFLKIARGADEPWKRKVLGQPDGWSAHEEEENKYREAERLRLLYVAGTRARELLVVCRSEKPGANQAWTDFESYVATVPELRVPARDTAPSTRAKAGECLDPAARGLAAAARTARHDLVRQPSWVATSVTSGDRASGEGDASSRARTADSGSRAAERAVQPGTPLVLGSSTDERSSGQTVGSADAGAEWGTLVHGLLEHAMRRRSAARADLERLARWLTVERPDLRSVIPNALDLVDAVRQAPFWKQAEERGEAHAEVPFAVRVEAGTSLPDAPAPTVPAVLHGVIDLVYLGVDGWHIIDYKTDRDASNEALLHQRHHAQLAQYEFAWKQASGTAVAATQIFAVRTMRLLG